MEILNGKDGYYVKFNTKLFKGLRKIQSNPNGADLKNEIVPIKKPPIEILLTAMVLLDELTKKYETEVMITINCGKNDSWYIDIPKQRVSSASVDFELDKTKYDEIYMEIHTHPSFGTTNFSGTDDADQCEKMRYYGVIGTMTINDAFKNKLKLSDAFIISDKIKNDVEKLLKLANERIKSSSYNYDNYYTLFNEKYTPFKKDKPFRERLKDFLADYIEVYAPLNVYLDGDLIAETIIDLLYDKKLPKEEVIKAVLEDHYDSFRDNITGQSEKKSLESLIRKGIENLALEFDINI